jgi:putative transposase
MHHFSRRRGCDPDLRGCGAFFVVSAELLSGRGRAYAGVHPSLRSVGGLAPTYEVSYVWLSSLAMAEHGSSCQVGRMPRYRRYFSEGQTVFLTLVTAARRPWLFPSDVKNEVLLALNETRKHHRFRHHGHVLLHDHLHLLLSPHQAVEIPRLVSSFKLSVLAKLRVPSTRERLWQRRYYDHVIRDDEDFARHLDYLHFNPIKHGFAFRPADWQWSSFRQWEARGRYPEDWGHHEPENIRDMSE